MSQAITTTETPGVARVRVQEILLGVAATAVFAGILTFWAWIAISLVQVQKDVVQLRSAVTRNTESIRHIERRLDSMDSRLDSMDSRLDSMDARLAAMQSSLALLVERSGGEAAPRR